MAESAIGLISSFVARELHGRKIEELSECEKGEFTEKLIRRVEEDGVDSCDILEWARRLGSPVQATLTLRFGGSHHHHDAHLPPPEAHHHAPQHHHQEPFGPKDRAEALQILSAAENSRDDARGSFEVVLKTAQDLKGPSLTEVARQFVAIQAAVGGAQSTGLARSFFDQAVEVTKRLRCPLNVAADALIRIHRAENSGQDALADFEIVTKTAEKFHAPLGKMAERFVEILGETGGAQATGTAQEKFEFLYATHPHAVAAEGGNPAERAEALQILAAAENSAKDAKENFLVVLAAVQELRERSLPEMARQFVRLQNAYGGAQETALTRAAFERAVKAAKRLDYPLHVVLHSIIELGAAENSWNDAWANFEIVAKAVHKQRLPLPETVRAFMAIQQQEGGAQATAEAQKTFKLVYGL